MKVAAYDSASPQQKVTTSVVFGIRRNEYPPQFSESLYEKEVTENFPLGARVLLVGATDRDQVGVTGRTDGRTEWQEDRHSQNGQIQYVF